MKLKQKIIIGIAVATSIAATAIALGVAFGATGFENNTNVKTVVYKTKVDEKQKETDDLPPEIEEPKKEEKKPELKPEQPKEEIIEEKPKEEKPKEVKPEPKEEPKEEPKKEPEPVPEPTPEPKKIEEEDIKKKFPDLIESDTPIEPPKIEFKPDTSKEPLLADDPEKPVIEQKIPSPRKTKVQFEGVDIDVIVRDKPNRKYYQSDIDKGLVGPDPFIADTTPDIEHVFVTEQFRQAGIKHTKSRFKEFIGSAGTSGLNKEFRTRKADGDLSLLISQNEQYWQRQIERFIRLFQTDRVRDFLTPEGYEQYPNWTVDKFKEELEKFELPRHPYASDESHANEVRKWKAQIPKRAEQMRYVKLLAHLDESKFKIYSPEAEEQLKKGYIPDDRNLYINERGEIDSNAYSPLPGYNKVVNSIKRQNKERRAIPYDSEYTRTPDQIVQGSYPGWTREDAKGDSRFTKYNINNIQGIGVYKLTRPQQSDGSINEALVVEFDFNDNLAYEKSRQLVRDLKNDGITINSYRFKNVGKKSNDQKMIDILKELPETLDQLEIFFENQNTSSLLALRSKKLIKELSLYTTSNALAEEWSINPLALMNVRWINSLDYNVPVDAPQGVRYPSRIVFNNLAFDEENIDTNYTTDWKRRYRHINNGLRMAYWVRNNEGIFQTMGSGLNPDHNEKGNSYPTGLDLSRTSLKSLRGLLFEDKKNPANGKRLLRRLVLKNNNSEFEIDASELNEAQFDVMDRSPMLMPPTKILFSNGKTTTHIRITDTSGVGLNSTGFENLSILKQLAVDNFGNNEIKVDNQYANLSKSLTERGYKVSGDQHLEIT
ncbi:putative immunoglobulin-blocking virulence protein [Ureaplasma diversum]|uniref:putative immunoglobulin-blocking virulence protein n=1 Tax=Ureaplasma diversum TaxID=42094 RepID=UPI000AD2E52A|nr:putative immunoglobulin-blocking virulence protein [Ureaplasma diversum]